MTKRLFTVVLIALFALGYSRLLPTPGAATGRPVWIYDDVDVAAAQRELAARVDTLRALTHRADQLHAEAALARLPRTRERFTFVAASGLRADTREVFAAPLRAAIEALGAPPRHPVRVVLTTDSMPPAAYRHRRMVLLPRGADEPCDVVIAIPAGRGAATPNLDPNEPLLGACGFYARFGMPGRGMQEWLFSTRGLMAKVDLPREPRALRPVRLRGYNIALDPSLTRCAADMLEACRELWDGKAAQRFWNRREAWIDTAIAPEVRHIVRGSRDDFYQSPGRNLGDLRSALGDARFAEVWRSELPPAEAYEALTGESIGSLARQALLREVEPHRPGPLHADFPTALAGALILVAAALGIQFAARRRSE